MNFNSFLWIFCFFSSNFCPKNVQKHQVTIINTSTINPPNQSARIGSTEHGEESMLNTKDNGHVIDEGNMKINEKKTIKETKMEDVNFEFGLLRVMTFNTWFGGQYVEDGVEKIVKHIHHVDADIVLLQVEV
jgi:hypothetical protein